MEFCFTKYNKFSVFQDEVKFIQPDSVISFNNVITMLLQKLQAICSPAAPARYRALVTTNAIER